MSDNKNMFQLYIVQNCAQDEAVQGIGSQTKVKVCWSVYLLCNYYILLLLLRI